MIAQPQNLLSQPFANNGDLQIIPDTAGTGRASLSAGFPPETQRPLAQGGIAPNRLDFNGILHMLSAAMFWQQSGGQWLWRIDLNYAVPCMVFHANRLWWCVNENGPGTAPSEPGTNESYWIDFLTAVANMGGGDTSGVPVGAIMAFFSHTAPTGYFECNGSTFSATQYPKLFASLGNNAILPELRGEFLRGWDNGRGIDPGRLLGTVQGDALQEMTGTIAAVSGKGIFSLGGGSSGVFGGQGYQQGSFSSGVNLTGAARIDFKASLMARTAHETRPHNVSVMYCIKHD